MSFVGVHWKNARNETVLTKIRSTFHSSISSHWTGEKIDVWTLDQNYKSWRSSHDSRDVLIVGELYKKEENFSAISRHSFFQHTRAGTPDLNEFWGNYVVFFHNKQDNYFSCVRSITGQVSFFYKTLIDGSVIFSSSIGTLLDTLKNTSIVKDLSFNSNFLLTSLLRGGSLTDSTAFEGIYELPPGCWLSFATEEPHISLAWDPSQYVNSNPYSKDVINTLLKVLDSSLNEKKDICLDFSGGLDSSVLLFALHRLYGDGDKNIKAINIHNSSIPSSNELESARKIAETLEIDLLEIDSNNFLPLSPFKKLSSLPNHPSTNFAQIRLEQEVWDMGNGTKSNFVNGHGSDHLFSCPPLKGLLADLIIDSKSTSLLKKTKELMIYFRKPASHFLLITLNNLIRYYSFYRHSYGDISAHDFPFWLHRDTKSLESQTKLHPFYYSASCYKMGPGKLAHIDAIYRVLGSIKGHIRNSQKSIFFPYLSQPLIEIGLSIPTYELFSQGVDRFPLRKKASDYFKSSHFTRRDKGETTGVFQLGVRRNLDYVLDLLSEGYFVKRGFVNKEDLLRNVKYISRGSSENHRAVMRIIGIELFLDLWRQQIAL